ncbi:signal transduction histidine kinase [Sphingomonas jejuensis]|uniref:histidine kinase n=1 Tax=Sphingomonas jejuensis TaxID=904715 RepID=A0ABX0XN29_9SPHN|nr:histidine kinase [Sphingomonas jejuensis]NJC34675.1 signal transduction histidine kinase [Sphingomonas jejuensis]
MSAIGFTQRPFFDDKNRAFWNLQTVGWAGYLILRAVSGFSNGLTASFIIPILVSTATGYSITLVMAAAFRVLSDRRPLVTYGGSIVTILLAAAIYSLIDAWIYNVVQGSGQAFNIRLLSGLIFLDFVVIAAWSALYFAINFYLVVEEQADQLTHLEGQATSAQLAMLRYQLNPHFLFNTLNSISTLVLLKQTDRANAMLSRLSSFLRYTLVNEPTAQVTVEQEVETLKLYLEIEKMRFEDRLRTSFDIDAAAAQAQLPSLLLQPLVENAIKYAVTPQEDGADISVGARLVGDRVLLTVRDSGPGLNDRSQLPSYSTGVGLANIRDRLSQAYGADHRFEAKTQPGGGFGVTIDIPFQTDQHSREAA